MARRQHGQVLQPARAVRVAPRFFVLETNPVRLRVCSGNLDWLLRQVSLWQDYEPERLPSTHRAMRRECQRKWACHNVAGVDRNLNPESDDFPESFFSSALSKSKVFSSSPCRYTASPLPVV